MSSLVTCNVRIHLKSQLLRSAAILTKQILDEVKLVEVCRTEAEKFKMKKVIMDKINYLSLDNNIAFLLATLSG